MMSRVIFGVNAVNEALKEGTGVVRLFIARGRSLERLREILRVARLRGVPISFRDKTYLDRLSSHCSHQGIIAISGRYHYFPLQDLIRSALNDKEKGLLLVADHITDAGNLGSLIRTAEFFGVQGLILPKDRSAPVTDAVHKKSAGASAYLPVARIANVARTLKVLADESFWIIGAAGGSATSIYDFDWCRSLVLALGSEDKGLSRLVRDRCHHLVSIPQFGRIDSLNLSVAGGIILSEILRQRSKKPLEE
jgi:23S rRNA (guanosine2251-2'-O)-methyltransferase